MIAQSPFVIALVLALCVSALSLIVTKANVSRPAREWIKSKSPWLGELVSCPFCFSFWAAAGAVLIYQPALVSSSVKLFDLAVGVFAIMAVAALVSGMIMALMDVAIVQEESKPRLSRTPEETGKQYR